MPKSRRLRSDAAEAAAEAIPDLDRLRDAAGESRIYLVGGAVRDLLLGLPLGDIDVVVEGDAAVVARELGADAVQHERFSTARATLGDVRLDLASARAESYPAPGALPEVRPADLIEDLARRDFTVNAMAIPLQGEPQLVDPHSGREDLERGLLRVLHEHSFIDDPTRALRAARYAARFGLKLEEATAELLRAADLRSVSEERRAAELLRIALEPEAGRGLQLAADWRLVRARQGAAELLPAVDALISKPPWSEFAARPRAMLVAALGPVGRESELAAARPARPSEAVDLARDARPEELLLARAMGAEWLDDYLREWRQVELEIDGSDLVAAGVPEGPAVGRGLNTALRRKLDGEIEGREEELRTALDAAKERGTSDERRATRDEPPADGDNNPDAVA